MALDSVQPVPCVLSVSMRLWRNHVVSGSQMVALVIEWRGFGQYIVGLVDKMPTLNEGCATKAAGEEHGSILLRALGVDLVVEQGHGLGNIGRDNRR